MNQSRLLGRHRLLCGDARSRTDVDRLIAGQAVDLVFTDPPCTVPVNGHVGGLGKTRHREFAFASGEMSTAGTEHLGRDSIAIWRERNALKRERDGVHSTKPEITHSRVRSCAECLASR